MITWITKKVKKLKHYSMTQSCGCLFRFQPSFLIPKILIKSPKPVPLCFTSTSMSDQADPSRPTSSKTSIAEQKYPVPISPPLPSISKNLELARALTASSKSSIFALSKSDVIYEDDWLIAVNKPQGVYCESVLASIPGFLSDSGDNVRGIQIRLPELHLANRLDRDTSGVMVITKFHKVAAKLVKAFTDHKVVKTYIAFCIGPTPEWKKMKIKSGHGRSKFGAWRVYAESDVGRSLPGGSVVRGMETSFEILSVNSQDISTLITSESNSDQQIIVESSTIGENGSRSGEVLVRACPLSGRTHQIRLHCQYLGIPIRGDVKYEGVYEWKGKIYDGHELHAESLCFDHPVTGLPVKLSAPLPPWALQAMSQ